jgi:hypothetical protein
MTTYRRNSSSLITRFSNGVGVQSLGQSSTTPESLPIYLYALNTGSGIFRPTNDTFAGFHFTDGLTDDEIADFHEAMQYLNDNIITGGR